MKKASVIGLASSLILLVISAVLAEEKFINPTVAAGLVVIATVIVIIAVVWAVKTDYETGRYECRKCGHTFRPTYKAYLCGAHTLKKRYLKCPECGEKSWCSRKTA